MIDILGGYDDPYADGEYLEADDMPIEMVLADMRLGEIVERDGEMWTLISRPPMNVEKKVLSGKFKERDDFRKIAAVPMRLAHATCEDAILYPISMIHRQAPWMRDVTTTFMNDLLANLERGQPWHHIQPTIILGPPGCGKTTYAHDVARLLGMTCARMDGTSMGAGFEISGLDVSWGSSQAGMPVRTMVSNRSANPMIIIDEIEKASSYSQQHRGDTMSALMPLLEPATAEAWRCPYLDAEVIMSRVSFLMIANDIRPLSGPLMDRCRVIEVRSPTGAELEAYVKEKIGSIAAPSVLDAALGVMRKKGSSLRSAQRLCQRIEQATRDAERKMRSH